MGETNEAQAPALKTADLNIIFVDVGVNYGDHGQDNYIAQQVDPSETVGELVTRLLAPPDWRGERTPKYPCRIEIRLAEPKPVPEPTPASKTHVEPF